MKYNNFLITGAASGLGKCLTNKLLELGKNVIGLDKDNIDVNLYNNRENLKTILFDLQDYDGINNLFINRKDFEDIECLINCAGYEAAGFVDEFPINEIVKNFNVITMAPIVLTKNLFPILKKNNGCIVNIISAMATIAVPGRMPYCMSKAALQMFSNVIRAEFKYSNVNVLTVYPEVMDTPFWESIVYFGRIKAEEINDPRNKRNPDTVAREVIKSIANNKTFFWRHSMTNYFAIIYYIFTNLGDQIVDVICKIKDTNIVKKG